MTSSDNFVVVINGDKLILNTADPARKIEMNFGEMWFRSGHLLENGELVRKTYIHRDDGPSVIFKDGRESLWHWFDQRTTPENVINQLHKTLAISEADLALLYLKYL